MDFLAEPRCDLRGARGPAVHTHPLWLQRSDSDVATARRYREEDRANPRRSSHAPRAGTRRNAFPKPAKSGICLLKIHGALDIFTCNDGEDLLKLLPDAPGEAGVIEVLRAANEDLFYLLPGARGGKAKTTNEITYADDHGEMKFLRRSLLAGAFKFDARSSQVLPMSMLRHFRANLNFVSTLICIGYGFGDQHINFAPREWLELSRDHRLEIVSPGVDNVPTALLHLSPQVTHSAMAATDYLDSRAGIVRSSLEKTGKRLASVLRSLGKKRADEAVTAFMQQHQHRMTQALLSRLQSLPVINGKRDYSSLGGPAEIGKQWAAEINPSEEELVRQILGYCDALVGEKTPETTPEKG
jgi:hypothetical protein